MFFCFCFKQKTAYYSRISDWSSDVCSSDLNGVCPMGINSLVDPNPVHARFLRIGSKLAPCSLGKADDGNARAAHAQLIDNGSRGRDYPLFELRRRKAACPAIEKLHGVYTCFHLSRQILYCEIRNGVDDCSKSGWVKIGRAHV